MRGRESAAVVLKCAGRYPPAFSSNSTNLYDLDFDRSFCSVQQFPFDGAIDALAGNVELLCGFSDGVGALCHEMGLYHSWLVCGMERLREVG